MTPASYRCKTPGTAGAPDLPHHPPERIVVMPSEMFAESSAVISDCGRYRYRLDRDCAPDGRSFGPRMAWIMVNPSTADAEQDDATIRRVVGFSRRHSCFRVTVGNLFAYRATDVRELKRVADPVGPENDIYLRGIMHEAQCVVVAWGPLAKQPKGLRDRFKRVAEIAEQMKRPLWCFGTANDGQPRHPLMLAYDTPLVPWSPEPGIRTSGGEG